MEAFLGSQNGNSELWSYQPANNNWNFKKGKYLATYNYGYSKGLNIEHYRNYPGDRRSAAMWTSGDYIYLFSGKKVPSVIALDFWRYNRLTNNLEQLYQGELNFEGHFGTMGVESELNVPPPVYDATTPVRARLIFRRVQAKTSDGGGGNFFLILICVCLYSGNLNIFASCNSISTALS